MTKYKLTLTEAHLKVVHNGLRKLTIEEGLDTFIEINRQITAMPAKRRGEPRLRKPNGLQTNARPDAE